jgi:hypothetical protein
MPCIFLTHRERIVREVPANDIIEAMFPKPF